MSKLFIEIIVQDAKRETETEIEKDLPEIYIPIESFLAIYVYRYLKESCPDSSVELYCLEYRSRSTKEEEDTSSSLSNIPIRSVEIRRILLEKFIPSRQVNHCINVSSLTDEEHEAIQDLCLPIFHGKDNNGIFISGICAVCRALVVNCLPLSSGLEALLGFKGSCLLAPADVSPWTRFCEVTIIEALKRKNLPDEVDIKALDYFEKHMSSPVRAHNIYKLAQEHLRQGSERVDRSTEGKKSEKSSNGYRLPKDKLPLEHRYAEGISFTIADLLLYPCIRLLTNGHPHQFSSRSRWPLIYTWFEEIQQNQSQCEEIFMDLCDLKRLEGRRSSISPEILFTSLSLETVKETNGNDLCKRNLLSGRRRRRRHLYDDKEELDNLLQKLKHIDTNYSNDLLCTTTRKDTVKHNRLAIDWNRFESFDGSGLPPERLLRKRQQLENLVEAIESLVQDGDRIVDFCSGSGHLGILLAMQLPKCTVILMENKWFSLQRAKSRVHQLQLSNVRLYQCNIDYYRGVFDIGTSLHACGTATDIVLHQCYRAQAKFVCCPCCYGSIQAMSSSSSSSTRIQYPASQPFQESGIKCPDFIRLAHAADQAHAPGTLNCHPDIIAKGKLCMKLVDMDRKLLAEQFGYIVSLTQLKPETCTPKNHLLMGVKKGQTERGRDGEKERGEISIKCL